MMGVISTGAVVTGSERRGRPKTVEQGNRELASIIASINAMGWAIPLFVIFQGKHQLSAWRLGYQRLWEWLDKQRAWTKVAEAL
jgi:hypothetical protein